ncbi:MAG: hypothetical protein CVU56_25150 [Deltaproteobacteria bacterium HGW-Deltaproteobacteria-14]|jgi:flagellar biosynthetic protein FlhB|nr:MAG: hypothetical protein CVU56_25150 [Deltaproteobacteria bacterium HGW-Deltaproteobacteria-14]
MADEQVPREERTFEPTQRRLDDFRKEGKVAVSKDLASTAQLLGVVVGFLVLGNTLFAGISGALRWVFEHVGEDGGQHMTLGTAVGAHLDALLFPTLALCVIFAAAATIAYALQTRFLFSSQAIGFKLDRLNAFKRLGDLFGPRKAGVRIGLSIAKVGLTGFVISLVLAEIMPRIASLGFGSLEGATAVVQSELYYLLIVTVVVLGVLAVLDWLWQRKQHGEQLRMTRQELKKETEDEEGRPEIKQRRRQRHRELSLNRILVEVPKADVIVTNPTHFAVALRYRAGKDVAPVVVAKGADEMAAHIRAIARKAGVPIVENRPLARSLYATVKVGKVIPQSLFSQVVQVLAKVYRAKRERGARV